MASDVRARWYISFVSLHPANAGVCPDEDITTTMQIQALTLVHEMEKAQGHECPLLSLCLVRGFCLLLNEHAETVIMNATNTVMSRTYPDESYDLCVGRLNVEFIDA